MVAFESDHDAAAELLADVCASNDRTEWGWMFALLTAKIEQLEKSAYLIASWRIAQKLVCCKTDAPDWVLAIALLIVQADVSAADRGVTTVANQQGAAILPLQTAANYRCGRL